MAYRAVNRNTLHPAVTETQHEIFDKHAKLGVLVNTVTPNERVIPNYPNSRVWAVCHWLARMGGLTLMRLNLFQLFAVIALLYAIGMCVQCVVSQVTGVPVQ